MHDHYNFEFVPSQPIANVNNSISHEPYVHPSRPIVPMHVIKYNAYSRSILSHYTHGVNQYPRPTQPHTLMQPYANRPCPSCRSVPARVHAQKSPTHAVHATITPTPMPCLLTPQVFSICQHIFPNFSCYMYVARKSLACDSYFLIFLKNIGGNFIWFFPSMFSTRQNQWYKLSDSHHHKVFQLHMDLVDQLV